MLEVPFEPVGRKWYQSFKKKGKPISMETEDMIVEAPKAELSEKDLEILALVDAALDEIKFANSTVASANMLNYFLDIRSAVVK